MDKIKLRQPQDSRPFWLKFLFITTLVIWISLILGNWLGHILIKSNFLNKGESGFINTPVDKEKPAQFPGKQEPSPLLGKKDFYDIRIASFESKENAAKLKNDLEKMGIKVEILEFDKEGKIYYRLVSGIYEDKSKAENDASKIKTIYNLNPIVHKKDE